MFPQNLLMDVRRYFFFCFLLLLLLAPPCSGRADASTPSPGPEVQALLDKAIAASKQNDLNAAQKALEAALGQAHALKDVPGEARTQFLFGLLYSAQQQYEKALPPMQQAATLYHTLHAPLFEATSLVQAAALYNDHLNQPQNALNYLKQALAPCRETHNKPLEAGILLAMGTISYTLDRYPQSVAYLEQALPLFEELHQTDEEMQALSRIALAYSDMIQPQKALQYSQRALQLKHEGGDKTGELLALLSIAQTYDDLGQKQLALDALLQATPLLDSFKNKKADASLLVAIGEMYRSLGQPQKAVEFDERAIPVLESLSDKSDLAIMFINAAQAYREVGKPQRALELYRKSLPLFHAENDLGREGIILGCMATLYANQGTRQTALTLHRQARPLLLAAIPKAHAAQDIRIEGYSLFYLGIGEEMDEKLADADRHLRGALNVVESIRGSLSGLTQNKISFLEELLFAYHRYIHLLLKRNLPAAAFAEVQQTKARALLDLMSNGKVALTQRLTEPEKQREKTLRRNADALNAAMVKEGVNNEVGAKARVAALKGQLGQAERELQAFEDGLYTRHPELAAQRAAKTATLPEIARALPEDTALLEYATLHANQFKDMHDVDQTVLFVVTQKQGVPQLQVYSLPIHYAELTAQAAALRAACADPRQAYLPRAQALYRALLQPAVAQIAGKKRLLVCPDGPLWDVPFAVLNDGRKFLLQRYELDFAYSATGAQAALAARRNQQQAPPSGTLLVCANPDFGDASRFGNDPDLPGQRPLDAPSRPLDAPSRVLDAPSRVLDAPSRALFLPRGGHIRRLPGTQQEADVLAHLFPQAAIYTGKEAQESVVKQQAGRYRYLHLASHAFFNDAAPLLSSIVLATPTVGSSDDGFLTAREIFDLKLNADMVVLSACNTARGEQHNGEGLIGLTWALFAAGAPTQVLSQWSVDDASTAILMNTFYTKMIKNGQEKGAALREAELTLLRDGKHTHPYFWAPFVLMGDWRR